MATRNTPERVLLDRLPSVVIAATYDHRELATVAFSEVSKLITKTDEREQGFLIKFPGNWGTSYYNVFMAEVLGRDLANQIEQTFFRSGKRFSQTIDFKQQLLKEWSLYIQGSTR